MDSIMVELKRLKSKGMIQTVESTFESHYIRSMAMKYLEFTLLNRIKVLWNLSPPMHDTEIAIELSRGVYSWSYEKFLARRRFKHVWIDVLMWEFEEVLLEKVKLHFDLSEVNRLVNTLFNAMYALLEGKSLDFGKYLWDPFIDVQKYLTLVEDLCSETQKNKAKELEYCNYLMVAWSPVTLPIIEETTQRLFEAIEIRYQLNWYRSKVNQMHLRYDMLQENYLKQITDQLQTSRTEENVGYNIIDVIYSNAETFRNLIAFFQDQYDRELEKVETDINQRNKRITKLIDHQKFLTEELVRFEEEIVARKALEIKRLEMAVSKSKYQIETAPVVKRISKRNAKGRGSRKKRKI